MFYAFELYVTYSVPGQKWNEHRTEKVEASDEVEARRTVIGLFNAEGFTVRHIDFRSKTPVTINEE